MRKNKPAKINMPGDAPMFSYTDKKPTHKVPVISPNDPLKGVVVKKLKPWDIDRKS